MNEEQYRIMHEALERIAMGVENGETFSGTTCAEIAEKALVNVERALTKIIDGSDKVDLCDHEPVINQRVTDDMVCRRCGSIIEWDEVKARYKETK